MRWCKLKIDFQLRFNYYQSWQNRNNDASTLIGWRSIVWSLHTDSLAMLNITKGLAITSVSEIMERESIRKCLKS